MNKFFALVLLAGLSSIAVAEPPSFEQGKFVGPSMSNMTPQMWHYTQEMRRREDPKEAVRRKAEIRAEQRRDRIAATKWYGYSNRRPQASLTPFYGTYSPTWSGNTADPFKWSSVSAPTISIGQSRSYLHR